MAKPFIDHLRLEIESVHVDGQSLRPDKGLNAAIVDLTFITKHIPDVIDPFMPDANRWLGYAHAKRAWISHSLGKEVVAVTDKYGKRAVSVICKDGTSILLPSNPGLHAFAVADWDAVLSLIPPTDEYYRRVRLFRACELSLAGRHAEAVREADLLRFFGCGHSSDWHELAKVYDRAKAIFPLRREELANAALKVRIVATDIRRVRLLP